jgi:hypothetical protein
MQFPTTQRELFDKLQLRLIVFKDKIEVKAVFPIPDIMLHECTLTSFSTFGLRGNDKPAMIDSSRS